MINKYILGLLRYLHITIVIITPAPSKDGMIPIDLNI